MHYKLKIFVYRTIFHSLRSLLRALIDPLASEADNKAKRANQLNASGGLYIQLEEEDYRLLENEAYLLEGFKSIVTSPSLAYLN